MLTGLVLGLVARYGLGPGPTLTWIVQNVALPLGQVFLRMIFMVVVPLVVSALALGVADIGDLSKFRSVGLKVFFFTLLFTSIAVLVGVGFANLFQPGIGLGDEARKALMTALQMPDAALKVEQAHQAKGLAQVLLDFIPKNPFFEAVNAFEGGLVPLMFFALMMGVGMLTVGPVKAAPLKSVLESIYAVMLAIIGFAMKVAPIGVGGLIFAVAATLGLDVVVMLGKYALVVVGALAFQQFIVYGAAVALIARRSPLKFFADTREPMLTAFSTSSSAATLPTAMKTAVEQLKLPKPISDFVLTVGSTLNHHGTALYEGITVLFLAQFFGVHLSLGQQFYVVGMAILGGIGTAGVPGGSLPMIVVIMQSVGVPGAGIGVILGVDRILDMCRTTLNVTGDLAIATVVAHLEGPVDVPADGVAIRPDQN
ncbi:MAG: gltP [Cyanobacteria bacterium RYN_339]|nr:gltP [Cyanobacteria bacterium RYN_339]